jgi:hypothetical protein
MSVRSLKCDPWIYNNDDSALVPDKALLWGLIAACKSKYKQDEKQDDTITFSFMFNIVNDCDSLKMTR